jgi:glycosyltransferase involved in cell wall biosynthesis
MLLSVVIPIGNFSSNFENIRNIVISSDHLTTQFVFILDTNETLAFQELHKLCATYLNKNYTVLISNDRNPGSSRNLGIGACSGEWIVFCDCDDLPYLVNIINSIATSNKNSQILIGSFEIEKLDLAENQTPNFELVINKDWETIANNPGIWRWVFRRSLVSSVRFPKSSMGEDQYFLIQILALEPKIEFTSKVLYKYRFGTVNSLTQSKKYLVDLVVVLKLELSIRKFPKKYSVLKNLLIFKQIVTLLKNGRFFQKLQALNFLLRFFFSISFSDYKTCVSFIVFLVRNR